MITFNELNTIRETMVVSIYVYAAADNVRFVTPNAGSYKFLYQDHTKE